LEPNVLRTDGDDHRPDQKKPGDDIAADTANVIEARNDELASMAHGSAFGLFDPAGHLFAVKRQSLKLSPPSFFVRHKLAF